MDPLVQILFVAVVCVVTGALAARKGYNFFFWVLAGGIIGLLALAFLPFTNKGENEQLKKRGNLIGSGISVVVVLAGLLMNYL